jgi:hypothetical protein
MLKILCDKWLCLVAFSVLGLLLWVWALLRWKKIAVHIPFFGDELTGTSRWGPD